jgi:hypothetical protein
MWPVVIECISNGCGEQAQYCNSYDNARDLIFRGGVHRPPAGGWDPPFHPHPKSAAAVVLSEIYSRQQAENPALQPAASE